MHRDAFGTLKIGRDALFGLLREHELLIARKRSKRRTTDSRDGLLTYQNLIKDHLPRRPNEVFVADITYLETVEGFRYVALIPDGYSRKIVGYDLSIEGSLGALKMALAQVGDVRDSSQ